MAADRREEGVAQVIRVERQPTPPDFQTKVGVKGADVLSKHKPVRPVPHKFWKGKEHWRNAWSDLFDSYRGLCAFTATRMEPVHGAPHVEHFKPKGKYPKYAYDWDNFRLVCARMNGRKGNFEDVLDPFELADNVFDINPLSGEIRVHSKCPKKFVGAAKRTIARLRLDDSECTKMRREHAQKCLKGDWSREEAFRQSPFVMACLKSLGLT